MSEKICECGHPLSEHFDNDRTKSLACAICCIEWQPGSKPPCIAFVWESGDEESDPNSPKCVDLGNM
jgi:hypothetical protein